jgi:chromosomal replication initiation ATPase DnaA
MPVAAAFKVDAGVLEHPSRCRGVVRIRHIALMIACNVFSYSRDEIGRRFNRDHSTIHYAKRKMEWLLDGAVSQIGEVS